MKQEITRQNDLNDAYIVNPNFLGINVIFPDFYLKTSNNSIF